MAVLRRLRRVGTTAVQDLLRAEKLALARRQDDLTAWSEALARGETRPAVDPVKIGDPTPPDLPATGAAAARQDLMARWWAERGSRWWNDLRFSNIAPENQYRLVTEFPALRNSVSIPAEVRDTLNRNYLHAVLEKLTVGFDRAARGVGAPLSEAEQRRLRQFEEASFALCEAELEARLTASLSGIATPDVHLLKFDPNASGPHAAMVVSFGNIDTAGFVAWHVPGFDTTLSVMSSGAIDGMNLYAAARQQDPATDAAVVIWLDDETRRESGTLSRVLNSAAALVAPRERRLRNALTAFAAARAAAGTEVPAVEVFDDRWRPDAESTDDYRLDRPVNHRLAQPAAALLIPEPGVSFDSGDKTIELEGDERAAVRPHENLTEQVWVLDPLGDDSESDWHLVPESVLGIAAPRLVRAEGPLFGPGGAVRIDDVHEVGVGSSALLALLLSLAKRPEWVRRIVRERPDGNFEVLFRTVEGGTVRVAVDRYFHAYGSAA